QRRPRCTTRHKRSHAPGRGHCNDRVYRPGSPAAWWSHPRVTFWNICPSAKPGGSIVESYGRSVYGIVLSGHSPAVDVSSAETGHQGALVPAGTLPTYVKQRG